MRLPTWLSRHASTRVTQLSIAFVLAACGGSGDPTGTSPTRDPQTPTPPSTPTTPPSTPATCAATPRWNTYMVDPAALKVVTQIGVVGGGNTELVGRSYVFPLSELTGTRIPLRAPANARVTVARRYIPPGAPSTYIPDWAMVLDMGCGRSFELYHVKDVSDAVKAVADTTPQNTSAWMPLTTPVPVKEGDIFAWYISGNNSTAFDVILHDAARTNRFVNQARYEAFRSNILDVVCPWTPFAPDKRDAYLAVVGTQEGTRIPGADCGTVERDVAGTPAGQWFGSPDLASAPSLTKNGDYGAPLPIVVGPDSTVNIGHIGPQNDIRIRRDNPTWRAPGTITTAWCYQIQPTPSTSDGWLWLRMSTPTQMDVAYSRTGTCPAEFPAEFQRYWR